MNTIFRVTEFVKHPDKYADGKITNDETFMYESDAFDFATDLLEDAKKLYGVIFDEDEDDNIYAFEYTNKAKGIKYELDITEVEIN